MIFFVRLFFVLTDVETDNNYKKSDKNPQQNNRGFAIY